MVLHHVAQRAAFIVIAAACTDAERLAHGDLNVIDVFIIPDRFEDRVGESHHHQVLDGFLTQIMIDAENLLFAEILVQQRVEGLGAGQITPEGFFDDDPFGCLARSIARLAKAGDDRLKSVWGSR